MSHKYDGALTITTPEEADKIVSTLADQVSPRDEELVRAEICAWSSIWHHQDYDRIVRLFRPPWPPLES